MVGFRRNTFEAVSIVCAVGLELFVELFVEFVLFVLFVLIILLSVVLIVLVLLVLLIYVVFNILFIVVSFIDVIVIFVFVTILCNTLPYYNYLSIFGSLFLIH